MKSLLTEIVKSHHTEAKWLNTLSLLESIGARKISLTVCKVSPSAQVLRHYADEARHAFAFKALCELVNKGPCDTYLCRDEAISYFQILESSVTEWLTELTGADDINQNYLLVTALIEKRALKIYPLYRSLTSHPQVKEELQKIIIEESDHKPGIEEAALELLKEHGQNDFGHLLELEEGLFDIFVNALQKELKLAA